ncbi:MAG: 23S rRNA (pseudouridine(1915)-N(3))-methyltransferase RlmH [Gammaproteobacteria bacterium]|nr:23S rRNA (pseudouridine(1915)-N(3))-methyltransferase RlmH [Gammaproteobacteria bacterium]
MKVVVAAVGRGMPDWIATGYHEYARRLSGGCHLELREIKAPQRRGGDLDKLRGREGDLLLEAVADTDLRIALDEGGHSWSTRQLAAHLGRWLEEGTDVGLMVGGADGLAPRVKEQAHRLWSLSPLTLPHMLVRVVVAEQIYRAWSVISGHPYHRD